MPGSDSIDTERRNMNFKVSRKEPRTVLVLGLAFLALAQIGSYVLQRKAGLPENIADFGSGLLQGIAIATLLLGIGLLARARKR
jgi:hypothetical protein